MPGNYPKENILHIEHGESLKSSIINLFSEHTTLLLAKIFRGIYQTNTMQLWLKPSNLYSKQCGDEVINKLGVYHK